MLTANARHVEEIVKILDSPANQLDAMSFTTGQQQHTPIEALVDRETGIVRECYADGCSTDRYLARPPGTEVITFLWAQYAVRDRKTRKILRSVDYIDGLEPYADRAAGVSPANLSEQAWANLQAAIELVNKRFFARAGVSPPS